jgi:aarF domain-containing kinase
METQLVWKSHAGGFEDDLENGMRKLAKDEFGVELDENAFMG